MALTVYNSFPMSFLEGKIKAANLVAWAVTTTAPLLTIHYRSPDADDETFRYELVRNPGTPDIQNLGARISRDGDIVSVYSSNLSWRWAPKGKGYGYQMDYIVLGDAVSGALIAFYPTGGWAFDEGAATRRMSFTNGLIFTAELTR